MGEPPKVQTMRTTGCLVVLAGALVAALPSSASAAEVTRVATAFEDENRFDIHLGLAYSYNFKSASILREWNTGQMTDDENRLVKDLRYQQQRHTLTAMLEVGLWHDLSLYVGLPVVIADSREYSFDQREGGDCIYGDDVSTSQPTATCVNKNNSTAVRDGIIPRNGFDASQSGAPFAQFAGPDTELIFRSPTRRGIDQFWVGIKYGILNQEKRSHMPNWIVAFDTRWGVGRPMKLTRNIADEDPASNHTVGRRVHEIGLSTALSRRYRFLDPFFTAFWRQSIRGAGSQFENLDSLGAFDKKNPQSQAGMSFGTEVVPFERKAKNIKVSILLEGSAVLHYGGRAYSEIWELLADSPAMVGANDPTMADQCDRDQAMAFAQMDPGNPDYVETGGPACKRFKGITAVQDYGTFGFNGALNMHLGKYVRLMLGVNVLTDTRHFLTFTNRGDADGGTDDDRVEAGTREVNPLRRDVVDNVGRRFVIDDVLDLYGYARIMLTF